MPPSVDAQRIPQSSSSARVVVLDTETTGLDPACDRIVEVACVELVNLVPSGRELHFYCNPERDMPADAFAVHGLSSEFLAGYPTFGDQVASFWSFIYGAEGVVAHNAEFDIRFLNSELQRCQLPELVCDVVDTLALARRQFPGAPASLDALCRRFAIDTSERTKHGALIDTRLLARVYLELMGGQQPDLALAARAELAGYSPLQGVDRPSRPPRRHEASEAELAAHRAMLEKLKDPIWLSA